MAEIQVAPGIVDSLRAESERNRLALEVAGQRAQLRALGRASPLASRDALESAFNYWDPSNFVNIMDYVGNGPYGYSLVNSPWISTRMDRDYGRNRPIFQTEMDLMAYRGMARLLVAYNANATGAVENLTSYVVGTGAIYSARPKGGSGWDVASVKRIVDGVQKIIDRFCERNDWDGEVAELKFQGWRMDGDLLEGLWHLGDGEVDQRIVLPEQLTEPADRHWRDIEEWIGRDDRPVEWTFGVCADDCDSQNVHGYYVQWTNRETDWDFLPGGKDPFYAPGSSNSWCQHLKANSPAGVKRGLTDFICIQELLNLARKIQLNMGTASSLASAIAWIIEHAPGILTTQIQTMIQSDAATSYTQANQSSNTRVNYVKQYNSGTVLHAPQGQKYGDGPAATNAPNFINVVESMLRSAAVRWSMPEHMITGNAGNNDYASILEAGSPFVKRASRMQQRLATHDRKVLWKVVEFAAGAGAIRDGRGEPVDFRTLERLVEIQVEPARVDVRNEAAETERNERLKKNGVISRKTWAAREGLDFEQERRNGLTDETEEAVQAGAKKTGMTFDEQKEPGNASHVPHAGLANGSESAIESTLESTDAHGHEHKGKGPGGGEFASKGGGGGSSGATAGKSKSVKGKAPSSSTRRTGPASGAESGAPTLRLASSKSRAFEGKPVALKARLSKQESGRLGEQIVLSWLRGNGFRDAGPMNTKQSNFPIDLFHDHATVEIKTGLASNSKDAQKWRLTIGEPGKEEKTWLAKASPEEKAAWNATKQQKIHDRKERILQELAKEIGEPIKPKTITVILNPDAKTADIYEFDGWHNLIGWNSELAKKGYRETVKYG